MRPLLAVPLVFSLIAWVLVLCAILAGKNGMRSYYAVGVSSHVCFLTDVEFTDLCIIVQYQPSWN